MKKVVFLDGESTKVMRGKVTFEEGFIKITDRFGKFIFVNKKAVVFIKELEGDESHE